MLSHDNLTWTAAIMSHVYKLSWVMHMGGREGRRDGGEEGWRGEKSNRKLVVKRYQVYIFYCMHMYMCTCVNVPCYTAN